MEVLAVSLQRQSVGTADTWRVNRIGLDADRPSHQPRQGRGKGFILLLSKSISCKGLASVERGVCETGCWNYREDLLQILTEPFAFSLGFTELSFSS